MNVFAAMAWLTPDVYIKGTLSQDDDSPAVNPPKEKDHKMVFYYAPFDCLAAALMAHAHLIGLNKFKRVIQKVDEPYVVIDGISYRGEEMVKKIVEQADIPLSNDFAHRLVETKNDHRNCGSWCPESLADDSDDED